MGIGVAAFALVSCGSGSTDEPAFCCNVTTFVVRRVGGPSIDYGSWDLEIRRAGENVRCAHTRGMWVCENGSYVDLEIRNQQGMPLESRIRDLSGEGLPASSSLVVRRSGEVLFAGPMLETSLTPRSPFCEQTFERTLEATVTSGSP